MARWTIALEILGLLTVGLCAWRPVVYWRKSLSRTFTEPFRVNRNDDLETSA